ncbi:MAG: hypothetical protein QME32_05890 [Endomicrobiia bacterium]|nr:hypothetical protein [Endomicrobiia bacterium]
MNNNKGQMLVIVLLAAMVLAIMIPAIVMWVHREVVWTTKEHKSTIAYNLAEAGVQRGVWKLKSSTATWNQAAQGLAISGYNFDNVFTDISGGEYRIRFSSGPDSKSITILSEGRSSSPKETRAIRAVYKNQTVPGAMITKGMITWANAFSAHWGPIMAHGNITITDANAAKDYFPRKYSRQVVSSNQAGYPRDTNGLVPPNSDGSGAGEWWSDYPVPDLPDLNFTAMESSATLTNTRNIYGCSKMSVNPNPAGHPWGWWGANNCNLGGGAGSHNGLKHFQNPWNHPWKLMQYTWYWPGDVIFTGDTGSRGCGIYGNIIVRGNMTNYCGDNYSFTGRVPSEAYMEYTKIYQTGAVSTFDTAAINQYPADNGLRQNRATFNFGGETWTAGGSPPTAANTDVGLRGFLYVGGNYQIEGPMDIYGAVWVAGNVSKAVGAERTIIFFDDNLDLPSLNVVLVRKSWDEIVPSTTPWP